MNKSFTVALALVAGVMGGVLTRYIVPPVALAQNQAPTTKEIRAQSFTLVDPSDRAVGTFTYEPALRSRGNILPSPQFLPNNQNIPERPMPMRIVLRDSSGRELWSAGGSGIQPLSER
jgi:hypothetical protein